MKVINSEGVPFNVRLVKIGEKYGRNDCLTADKPMIEFFDARQSVEKFGPLGQFVSRYFVSTLCEDRARLVRSGLMLDGGDPAWVVSGENVRDVLAIFCNDS